MDCGKSELLLEDRVHESDILTHTAAYPLAAVQRGVPTQPTAPTPPPTGKSHDYMIALMGFCWYCRTNRSTSFHMFPLITMNSVTTLIRFATETTRPFVLPLKIVRTLQAQLELSGLECVCFVRVCSLGVVSTETQGEHTSNLPLNQATHILAHTRTHAQSQIFRTLLPFA